MTLTESVPRHAPRVISYVVALLGAMASAVYIMATPWTTRVDIEIGGNVVNHGSTNIRAWAVALIVVQAIAMLLALASVAAGLAVGDRLAKRLLLIAAIAGLVPAIVPGLLTGLARHLLTRAQPHG